MGNAIGMFFITGIVGVLTVLQGAINRRIGGTIGLLPAVAMNTVILGATIVAAGIWMMRSPGTLSQIGFSAFLPKMGGFSQSRWWWLVPGLCGFLILILIPASIMRLGALASFVWLVTGQMIGSLFWDLLVEGVKITALRLAAVGCVTAGAWLMTLAQK